MRKRKYLIGALLGVIGALVVLGRRLGGRRPARRCRRRSSPAKQDKKTFGGVSLHNIIAPRSTTGGFTVAEDDQTFMIVHQGRQVRQPGNIPPAT